MNQISTRSTTETEIASLREQLRPVAPDFVSRMLTSLMKSGLHISTSIAVEDRDVVYGFALAACSKTGVERVVRQILTGHTAIFSGFIPLPAELAKWAREADKADREHLARLTRDQAARLEMAREQARQKPDDARASVLASLAKFRQAHSDHKASEAGFTPVIDVPYSPEKSDEMRAMLALPDAKEVNQEHLARRRVVSAKMENTQ